jgi:AcrR family transcriptional regulator
VEAILEATFQLLESDGLTNLTTNHIAERAGVSIGTLYQYFSDREEILYALSKRQSDDVRNMITRLVLESPETTGVRAIIRALMHGPKGNPQTRLILSDALFRSGGSDEMSRQHIAFLESISGRQSFDFPQGREAAFILTHAVVQLLRAAAGEPELQLDPGVLEDELVHLLESYIENLNRRTGRMEA